MSADLTVLYYTCNRIAPAFAGAVQDRLLESLATYRRFRFHQGAYVTVPIVSVSHKPLTFGANICVGDVPPSIYQVYVNVLIGAKAASTRWVAMAEDDSLYSPEHFAFTPPRDDVFYYNRNRWVLTQRRSDDQRSRTAVFYWRLRTQQAQLICARTLLIETLEERFAKYPTPVDHETAKRTGWGEPGRYEKNLGLTMRAREYFTTSQPNVTVNHGESLMGRRQVQDTDVLRDDLEPWGKADELWRRVHG